MIDKRRIQLMAKLAIHEKNYGKQDMKADGYYKNDYIYIHNWWTRVSVLIGASVLVVFFILQKLFVEQVDVLELNYRAEGIKIAVFLLLTLVFYSFLGNVIYGRKYDIAQRRLSRYFKMLNQLDQYTHSQEQSEEANEETYEANLSNQRNDDRLL